VVVEVATGGGGCGGFIVKDCAGSCDGSSFPYFAVKFSERKREREMGNKWINQ